MSDAEIEQMDLKRKRSDDEELVENKRAKVELMNDGFDQSCFNNFIQRAKQNKHARLLQFINNVEPNHVIECPHCNKKRFLYQYSQREKYKNGLEIWKCLICKHQSKRDTLSNILTGMKKRTEERNAKGRKHEPIFYKKIDDLEKLLQEQNYLCYYSNEEMKTWSDISHDGQVISIERLDDKIGYSRDNCVFVCLKYNFCDRNNLSAEQKKKYVEAMMNPVELKDFISPLTKKDFEKPQRSQKKREVRETKVEDGIQLQKCSLCREFLPSERFRKLRNTIHTQCKKCQNAHDRQRVNTPNGVIEQKIKDAKRHANDRAEKNNRDDESDIVDVNLKELVIERLFEQNLCCAVTKLPFVFELGSPETPSIKRIDNTKGYVKGNICLVLGVINNSAVEC